MAQWYDGGGSDWDTAWFRVEPGESFAVVRAGGEVDYATIEGLRVAMQSALTMSASVVVDMTHVTFVDSTGLGVLIRARNQAQERDGLVALAGPPDMVRKVLAATRLQSLFPVFGGAAEAVAAISRR